MANRVQLNDDQLDMVTGGAFNFYAGKDGQKQVYVDGVGTFNCSDAASAWIISQITSGNNSPAAVVEEAVAQGLLWK